MNSEVIYLNESDRKRAVKPEPLTIEQFVGIKGDPKLKESIEKYVKYRIQFEKEIKKVLLGSNKRTDLFNKIVYLGKSYNDDTFACYTGTHWEIVYGELNSGMY